LIRFKGKSHNNCSTASGLSAVLVDLTTSPRVIGEISIRVETEYQLINANETPESFKAIQVPPPGSEGQRTSRFCIAFNAGGRLCGRTSFSSRFIARQYPLPRGMNVTVHISLVFFALDSYYLAKIWVVRSQN
jgi:hypothetical protein